MRSNKYPLPEWHGFAQRIEYKYGTWIEQNFPFGLFVRASVLCPDGKVRLTKRISQTADTYFSVPCSIRFKGKTVAGYMKMEEDHVAFVPYKNRKNGNIFAQAAQLDLPL
jgi:hypothetical protein